MLLRYTRDCRNILIELWRVKINIGVKKTSHESLHDSGDLTGMTVVLNVKGGNRVFAHIGSATDDPYATIGALSELAMKIRESAS